MKVWTSKQTQPPSECVPFLPTNSTQQLAQTDIQPNCTYKNKSSIIMYHRQPPGVVVSSWTHHILYYYLSDGTTLPAPITGIALMLLWPWEWELVVAIPWRHGLLLYYTNVCIVITHCVGHCSGSIHHNIIEGEVWLLIKTHTTHKTYDLILRLTRQRVSSSHWPKGAEWDKKNYGRQSLLSWKIKSLTKV